MEAAIQEALSLRPVAGNAFRVLGLPSGATQAEIEGAARRMRIFVDPAQIPPTDYDFGWLGPVGRTRGDVERAVVRLMEPGSRIEERLFWFADPALARRAPRSWWMNSGVSGHDGAVHDLAAALILDPNIKDSKRWSAALRGMAGAMAAAEYREWIFAVERDGDFEKRAEPEEITGAALGLPRMLAEAIAARARGALDGGDGKACVRYVQLIRSAAWDEAVAIQLQANVCDRIEDLLLPRCARVNNDVYRGLGELGKGKWRSRRQAHRVCKQAAREFDRFIEPLLTALTQIEGTRSERMRRVAGPAARLQRNLWVGWAKAGRRMKSRNAMRYAVHLADGTPAANTLRTELDQSEKLTKKRGIASGWGVGVWLTIMAVNMLSQQWKTTSVDVPQNYSFPSYPSVKIPRALTPTPYPSPYPTLEPQLITVPPAFIPTPAPKAEPAPAAKPRSSPYPLWIPIDPPNLQPGAPPSGGGMGAGRR